MSHAPDRFATDGYVQALADMLEERSSRIRGYVETATACTRDELSRFIWGTAKYVYNQIKPVESEPRRMKAWQDARGLLKELIDFKKFTPLQYVQDCVEDVLEDKVLLSLDNYRNYVLTGEIRTRWPPPKLLGETDELLCVDKPCGYTCSYGGSNKEVPKRQLGHLGDKASASMLLNGDSPGIQLHEYLALKYNFETAIGTRNWWFQRPPPTEQPCLCGYCEVCACTQSGCCNRLDRETSGVMICAKTKKGFCEIRRQFSSKLSMHRLEEGGTEKYYMALARGTLELPTQPDVKSKDWKHTLCTQRGSRGRIEINQYQLETKKGKALPWDKGEGPPEGLPSNVSAQPSITFYEPVAWFSSPERKETYTLCKVQIITGCFHQIRFHLAELGFPLVGDSNYGAPHRDREWCNRVFLHSYKTKFREPFTARWFEANSPLPQDLGQILAGLQLDRVRPCSDEWPLLSRRNHPELVQVLKQYDPNLPLLVSHDAPVNVEEVMAKVASQNAAAAGASWGAGQWGGKGGQKGGPKGGQKGGPKGGPKGKGGGKWQERQEKEKGGWQSGGGWGSSSGSQGWGSGWSSGGWQGDSWKSGSWQEEKPQGQEWEQPKIGSAPAPDTAEDDDDDWGGWKAKEEPATAVPQAPDREEPPAKRLRLDAPPAPGGAAVFTDTAAWPTPQGYPMPTPTGAAAPAWRRMESRSQPGIFYYWNPATGQTDPEPPPPWRKMESRSQPGHFYYWHEATGATTGQKPEL